MDSLQLISKPVMLGGRKQSWSKGFPVKLAESKVSVWEVLEMDGCNSLTHQKRVNEELETGPWWSTLLHKCEDLSSDPQDTHKAGHICSNVCNPRGGRQKSPQKLKGQVSEAYTGTNKRPYLKQDGRCAPTPKVVL